MKKLLLFLFVLLLLFLNSAYSQPKLRIIDSTVNFDTTKYSTSKVKFSRIENPGNFTLDISLIDSLAPPFSLVSGLPINLAPGGNTSISFRYTPPAPVSNDSQYVYIKSNATDICVALLIDRTGSMADPLSGSDATVKMTAAKDAAKAFVNKFFTLLHYTIEAGIFSFNTALTTNQTFTTDSASLKSAINTLSASGSTYLYSAIVNTLDQLKSRTYRKYLVVLTDGGDTQYPDPTTANARRMLYKIIDTAKANGITIYTVGISAADSTVLKKLADSTGGEFFTTQNSAELTAFYENIPIIFSIYNRIQLKGLAYQDSNFTLITNVAAGGGGSVTGNNGAYTLNQTATITAHPDSCHTFSGWTGDYVGAGNPASFVMTSNRTVTANFTTIKYPLTINAAAGGSVTGNTGSPYDCGTSKTITAVPDPCYTFTHWLIGSNILDTARSVTVRMDSAKTLTPVFAGIQYPLNTSVSPALGGSIAGNVGSPYNCGSVITLTASPNGCGAFINWTEGGVQLTTNPVYAVTMSGPRTLVANFTTVKYSLTTTPSPIGGGIINGNTSSPYNCNTPLTLTAVPSACYQFVKWTDGGGTQLSTNPVLPITMDANKDVIAVFSTVTYPLTTSANPVAGGSVNGNNASPYNCGNVVNLTAAPSTCYEFVNWTKGGTVLGTSTSLAVTMDTAKNIVGNFTKIKYPLTTSANPVAGGTVTGNNASPYDCGTPLTLTAVPNPCYEFVNWTLGGTVLGTSTTLAVTMDTAKSIVANFVKSKYALTTNASPASGGSVNGNTASPYDCGTPVTLTPVPNDCYKFVKWTSGIVDLGTNIPLTVIMDTTKNITANFEKIKYSLTAVPNPMRGGVVVGNDSSPYDCGTTVTITAVSSSCYKFIKWTEGGIEISTDPTIPVFMSGSRNLVAVFGDAVYSLTTNVNPVGTGTISGNVASPYTCNTLVPLTATPIPCYEFINWTLGGTILSTSPTYSVTMDTSKNLTANFAKIKYSLFTNASPVEGGSVIGNNSSPYDCNTIVNLTARPNACYVFKKWTMNGIEIGTNPIFPVTMDSSKNILAIFERSKFDLITSVNPNGGGFITGNDNSPYDCNSPVSITATPNACYEFINWTSGTTVLGTSSTLNIIMDTSKNIVANFTKIKYNLTTSVSPAATGTVTGNDSSPYDCGTPVTLTAVPNSCYSFVKWTRNGFDIGTSANLQIRMDSSQNIIAVFEKNKYNIATFSSPAEAGIVHGNTSSPYTCDTIIHLSTTPAEGYEFVGWSNSNGNIIGTDTALNYRVNSSQNITAVFKKKKYPLTTTSTIGGKILRDTSTTFEHGTIVTIKAVPEPCYKFTGWTKNGVIISTDSVLQVKMDSAVSVQASFEKSRYKLTTSSNPLSGGTIARDTNSTFDCGSILTLTETPNPCYNFINWTQNGKIIGTSSTIQVTMDSSKNIIANFETARYTLASIVSPLKAGTIQGNDSTDYECNHTVYLKAVSTECSQFTRWTEGGIEISTNPIIPITLDRSRKVTAEFQVFKYNIVANPVPLNGGSIKGKLGILECGTPDTLIAKPSNCYKFVNWVEDSLEISKDSILIFSVKKDRNLIANFTTLIYPLTTIVSPVGTGIIKGNNASPYLCGTPITLTAIPDSCQRFKQWTEDGVVISTNPILQITMNSARTIIAEFEKIRYTVTAIVNPVGRGSISGLPPNIFDCGSNVTLIARHGCCYFLNWTENDTLITTDSILNIYNLNRDRNFVANFRVNFYTINTGESNDTGAVTGNNDSYYTCNSTITLTANPKSCFEFIGWSENGVIFSTVNPLSFDIDRNRNIIPIYKKLSYSLFSNVDPLNSGDIKRDTNANFDCGSKLRLTATPRECYKFDGWYENNVRISSDSIIDITLDKNRSLTSRFSILRYSVTTNVVPAAGGKINGALPVYDCGSKLEVYYAENRCYKFDKWTYRINGQTFTSTLNPLSLPVKGNIDISAEFTYKNYILTTSVNIPYAGTISKTPDKPGYLCDEIVRLDVVPTKCYIFKYWSDDTTNKSSSRNIVMDTNKNIQAIFAVKQYPINLSSNIPNTGSFILSPNKSTYDCGEKVKITFVPDPCYKFMNWNNQSSMNNSSIDINVDSINNFSAQVAKIEMDFSQILTNNLPNVLLKFSIDSIINSNRFQVQPLSKSSLTVLDSSSCKSISVIGSENYTLDTKIIPRDILYDLGSKAFNKPCDTLRYATIIFSKDGCTLRQTLSYIVPLNFGCDSCSRILVKKDSLNNSQFRLYSNFPNPFNPSTEIKYLVSKPSVVKIVIYDVIGREITVFEKNYLEPGDYTFTFIPNNLPGGIYFYRMITTGYTEVKKMIYLK